MMDDIFCYNDVQILDEELEDCICGTYSAARFLELLEGEDPAVLEDFFSTLEKCKITLDVSKLPQWEGTGSDALRLKQEMQYETLEAITVGLEERDPLVLYLKELEATPAAGDVQLLATQYLEGQHHLAERILQLCLGLVTEIALEYTGHGVLLMDLIQEGNMGLWECLPYYEEGDFLTHARWWIRHSMAKILVQQAHNSGVGAMLREDIELYLRADRELLSKLGRNPTREEIAQHMGLELNEVLTIEKMIEDAKAHESVKKEEEEPELTQDDQLAVEDTAYFQLRQRITELLSTLTEQESRLLSLRFGLEGGKPMSPEQTGRELNMTPAEVVATEAAALAKLRTQ